ncbi:MAG: 1-deoxy-D-xylulose-5-phosphate reductoisomerase [Planctomycetaceae bacterium]|nr:1-deoxy-D-xylulose-5-phosphate reductoisomerase [Planctomycetaceae bacterium]
MNASASQHGRRLMLLGSTGSIGVNTLRVVDNLGNDFDVVGLAAGRNAQLLGEQARRFNASHVALAAEAHAGAIRGELNGTRLHLGADAAREMVEAADADVLVAAVVGAAGLPATLAAIRKGMMIALANKETLVAAGELVNPLMRQHGTTLVPVDSEHSAIFQCLQTANGAEQRKTVKRIVLTASGGPFRKATRKQIERATVAEALNHPTWDMGPKITIDSATMMNKALEIIEAHWLFDLAADEIDVIIHPQSVVHSFVEFTDHSVLAQLGPPDMKTPIQYALTYPDRSPGCSDPMDWATLSSLEFEPPDHERFPSLGLAYRVIETGGTSGAVMNAANEAAVEAFLGERIRFGGIVPLVAEAMDAIKPRPVTDLDTVLEADRAARAFVRDRIDR